MVGKTRKESSSAIQSGIKVIEYCDFVSGPYCAKLLGNFGLKVIKVERPGLGDEARRRGPFPNDVADQERSGLFLYLNTDKLGITLNIETPEGASIFRKLCQAADILVENQPVGKMKKLGLDYEALSSLNPSLVVASISPFGQVGPYSTYRAHYLNTFHAGGEGYLLPGGLDSELYPSRGPIKAGGYVGEYDAGVHAAIVVLAALYARASTGRGQHIDVSQQECLTSICRNDIMEYDDGVLETRQTQSLPVAGPTRCRDGDVIIRPNEEHMWDGLVEAMGKPAWASEERYQWRNMSDWHGHVDERREATQFIGEWAKGQTKWEVFNKCRANGCAAGVVCTPEDVLESEQNRIRGFFAEIDHPKAGKMKYPAFPWKSSKTCQPTHGAPLLGEHNGQVYCGWLGYDQADLARLRQAGVI